MAKKDALLQVRITSELKKAVAEICEKNNTTTSEQMIDRLKEIKKKGKV